MPPAPPTDPRYQPQPPPGPYPTNPGYPGYPPPAGYAAYAYAPPPAPRPGVIPLRPLGIGEILDGSIQSVRRNPRIMLGLSAVVATFTQLLSFAASWSFIQDVNALDPATASGDDFLAAYSGLATGSLPAFFVGTIAQTILVGLLTVVVGRAALGQSTTLSLAWDQFKPRLLRLFGLSIVVTVATWGVLALGVGIVVGLAFAVTPFFSYSFPFPWRRRSSSTSSGGSPALPSSWRRPGYSSPCAGRTA